MRLLSPTTVDTDRNISPDLITVLNLLPTMPPEIQDRVFEFCGMSSLAVLCQLNKNWYEKTIGRLWGDINFVWESDDEDQVESTRRFFAVCDSLMNEKLERWVFLAPLVRKLDLGRLHGVNIIHDGEWDDSDDFIFFDDGMDDRQNIFDVIAQFVNLHTLSVYVKNWWGFGGTSLEASGKRLAERITKLSSLKIGGQISTDILLGLLARPEGIKHLSLINLIETPGQSHGPDGIVFLSDIHQRFTQLNTLHLCKLADLDGRLSDESEEDENEEQEYESGMRWRFPRQCETLVLEEWAGLLRHCLGTLVELVLENRYLCSSGFNDGGLKINPGESHPAEYGAHSIQESQNILFPVLSGTWPKLKKLTLIGMGEIEDINRAVRHLEPQVKVEQCLAGIQIMGGDATPDQISTPIEFYD